MEFIKLWRLHQDTEVDHITEAGRLAILVSDVSKVLINLACPPSRRSRGIDTQSATSWRWWTPPAMAPGIRCRLLVAIVSVIHPALAFCFIFILFLDVKYFKDLVPFIFLHHQACRHHP
jgi:hypothetical protein